MVLLQSHRSRCTLSGVLPAVKIYTSSSVNGNDMTGQLKNEANHQ